MGSGEKVLGEEEVSEGTGVAAGMRVLVGATASGVEEQAQATRATADMQMRRRSNLKEERVGGIVTILERVLLPGWREGH